MKGFVHSDRPSERGFHLVCHPCDCFVIYLWSWRRFRFWWRTRRHPRRFPLFACVCGDCVPCDECGAGY